MTHIFSWIYLRAAFDSMQGFLIWLVSAQQPINTGAAGDVYRLSYLELIFFFALYISRLIETPFCKVFRYRKVASSVFLVIRLTLGQHIQRLKVLRTHTFSNSWAYCLLLSFESLYNRVQLADLLMKNVS